MVRRTKSCDGHHDGAASRTLPLCEFETMPVPNPDKPSSGEPTPDEIVCTTCGACCATSANWPRFSLETDAALALIPEALVAPGLGGMRCTGDRCDALRGIVGQQTSCTIYACRPIVCRDCSIGDPECVLARKRHRLPPLPADGG